MPCLSFPTSISNRPLVLCHQIVSDRMILPKIWSTCQGCLRSQPSQRKSVPIVVALVIHRIIVMMHTWSCANTGKQHQNRLPMSMKSPCCDRHHMDRGSLLLLLLSLLLLSLFCCCCCCYCCCCCCFYFGKLFVILLRWAIVLWVSVGDCGIYPMAMTSSGDMAADVGCHHVTQRKRKVVKISKFENSPWAFSELWHLFLRMHTVCWIHVLSYTVVTLTKIQIHGHLLMFRLFGNLAEI